MGAKPESDNYSEAEADRRFAGALKRALTTPHKPNEEFKGKSAVTGKRIRKAATPKTKRKRK